MRYGTKLFVDLVQKSRMVFCPVFKMRLHCGGRLFIPEQLSSVDSGDEATQNV